MEMSFREEVIYTKTRFNYNPTFKMLIDNEMTKKQLSEKAAISISCLTRMKNGRPVSIEALTNIAEVLGCEVTDLYYKISV